MQIRDIRRIEEVIRGNQNIISARHPVLFGWGQMQISDDDEVPFSISITIYSLLSGNQPRMCVLSAVVAPLHYNIIKDKAMKFCIAEQRVFNDIKD